MVKEYTDRYYMPAAQTGVQYANGDFALAREMAHCKQQMRGRWGQVSVQAIVPANTQLTVGETVTVGARVWFNGLSEGDAAVEVVSGAINANGELSHQQITPMHHSGWDNGAAIYQCALQPETSGNIVLGIRARPHKPSLINPAELGIASWAS